MCDTSCLTRSMVYLVKEHELPIYEKILTGCILLRASRVQGQKT